MSISRHRVIVIGGGFGGVQAVQTLKRAPVDITLIDRRNYYLFQPLLYQVATGGLSPANIAVPLRALFKRQRNVQVFMGEVQRIDIEKRQVCFAGRCLEYDTLIIATGSRHQYFGHEQWAPYAPGLKSVEDATEIRRRVLLSFEKAELETDPPKIQKLLTFVIIGGGPTGVELAGALAEIARETLQHDFRHINPANARILIVDSADRVLPTYPPELSEKAAQSLGRLGVTIRNKCKVTDICAEQLTVESDGKSETIPANTILWAAGVLASPLGRGLAEATGAELDRAGRIVVEPDLSLRAHPEVFVIGDLALYKHQDGKPLPGVAPVAMQQGRYVAELIRARLKGRSLPPFQYRDRGNMATIGRASGVVDLGWWKFSGFFAWITWLFVHLMYLVQFENRLLVLLQWAWNYFTRNRSARLITETAGTPPQLPRPPANPELPRS